MPQPPSRLSKTEHALDEFFRELESISDQVQKLLNDVRSSEIDFAAFKVELRILCENVKSLSDVLKNGDGKVSLPTKLALLEHQILELKKSVDEVETKLESQTTADKTGRWQMKIALITGAFGLIAAVVNIIIHMSGSK